MFRISVSRGFALLPLLLMHSLPAGASRTSAPSDPSDLPAAVRTMRKVDVKGLPQDQQAAKAEALSEAWEKLTAAGPAGSDALLAELKKIDAAGERDDYFKLGAAVVLWQIGQTGSAEIIATLWSGDTDLTLNYRYVFHTAFGAARTRDPRVFPMLIAILRDRKGQLDLPEFASKVRWPETHAILWGAYGSKGVPRLKSLLSSAKDAETLASVAELLGTDQDEASLPVLRRLAKEGPPAAKISALRALGSLGHPADFDLLAASARSQDPEVVFAATYALFEYGDLRAVPALVPVLASTDASLRSEAAATLGHLLTPEGIEALRGCAATGTAERRQSCQEPLTAALQAMGTTEKAWKDRNESERRRLTARALRNEEARLHAGNKDRKLSRGDLRDAVTEWTIKRSLEGGAFGWVKDRHLIAATTAADIPLLHDLRAAVLTRLSDDAVGEARRIDHLVQRLGRLRYRKEPGTCAKAEGR